MDKMRYFEKAAYSDGVGSGYKTEEKNSENVFLGTTGFAEKIPGKLGNPNP